MSFPTNRADDTTAQLSVLIHDDADDARTVPLSSWQTLRALCIATPSISLPKRLVTSITWSDEDIFLDKPTDARDGPKSFLAMYRRLGFNTMPKKSFTTYFNQWEADRSIDNNTVTLTATAARFPHLLPAGRTGPLWEGVYYGPEDSATIVSSGVSYVSSKAPNASLLPAGLTSSQTTVELAKWQRAFDFKAKTGHLDVAYDGIFFQRFARRLCELAKITSADYIYMDDESFGEGFATWQHEAALSANAAARALPGETSFDLAWRMAAELMQAWTKCVTVNAPNTTVAWYGGGFPDPIYSDAGISAQPSEYSPEHYLASYSGSIRAAKQNQV